MEYSSVSTCINLKRAKNTTNELFLLLFFDLSGNWESLLPCYIRGLRLQYVQRKFRENALRYK